MTRRASHVATNSPVTNTAELKRLSMALASILASEIQREREAIATNSNTEGTKK